MSLKDIFGDYHTFYTNIITNLAQEKINISNYPLSHLGYKTHTMDDYHHIKTKLLLHSHSYLENSHNHRPIAKCVLKQPITFSKNHIISLIELMPPKSDKEYSSGLEHLGVVIGKDFESFKTTHLSKFTGQQNQGPYCQPLFIRFSNGSRVKFYQHSLQEVAHLEGHQFTPIIDQPTTL